MDSFIYALVLVPSLRELLPRSGIAATKGNIGLYGGLFFALFLLFVMRPHWLAWFGSVPMVAVGAASYSLYLLHQDIGVTVLSLRTAAGAPVHSSAWLAVTVAGCLVVLSVGIYRFWEMPAKNRILRWRRAVRLQSA